jgi:hypothetical protein
MSRRSRGETHRVTLRIPKGVHADLVTVADAKHLDLSVLLNQIIAEARPALMKSLREERADLAAARNGKET